MLLYTKKVLAWEVHEIDLVFLNQLTFSLFLNQLIRTTLRNSGESPPWIDKNFPLIIAAIGKKSKDSINISYISWSNLYLPMFFKLNDDKNIYTFIAEIEKRGHLTAFMVASDKKNGFFVTHLKEIIGKPLKHLYFD